MRPERLFRAVDVAPPPATRRTDVRLAEILLYDVNDSPFCLKARICLNVKGVPFRRVALTVGRLRELRAETERWCRELLEKSPTALKLAKQSFNADTEHIAGITELGFAALELYYQTEEAMEGRNAFLEKRAPQFRKKRS